MTSINDLTTFTEALLANKIMNAESRAEMLKPVIFIPYKHQFPTFDEEKGTEGPPWVLHTAQGGVC